MPLNDTADRSGMKVQKNGTIIGIVQSEDPVKVRVQVKLDEESHEQRVRPFPRSEEEKMAEQMTEQIAQQLRGLIPGVLIGGPGASGGLGSHVEEWLVPSDEAAKLSVGRRVRVSLELVEE